MFSEEPIGVRYTLPSSKWQIAGLHWRAENHKAPMILCLHGWLDNAMSFFPLAQHLSGYQVLALDLPGHGLSSHAPPGSLYHWSDYVTCVVELLQEQIARPVTLLGHSMGAGVASLLAGIRAEYVDQIILIEGLGLLTQAEGDAPAQLERYLAARKKWSKRPTHHGYVKWEDAVKARMNAGDLTEEAAKMLTLRNLYQDEQGLFQWRYDGRLKWPSPFRLSEAQSNAFLKNIDRPSLLLLARDSKLFSSTQLASERAHLVANLKMIELATGGHHLHMTECKASAAYITGFLEQPHGV